MCAPRGVVPFLRGKSVALALTRALQHCSTLLGKSYLSYSEIPVGTWSELYSLMSFAGAIGQADKSCSDPHVPGVNLSPLSVFSQALLLFLANPYRYTHKEMSELDCACRVWAALTSLSYNNSGRGVFTIDPELDMPPGVHPPQSEEQLPTLTWRFDTRPLVHQLGLHLAEHAGIKPTEVIPKSKIGQSAAVSASLVERSMLAWAFSGERSQPRMTGGYAMDAALGLQAAHFLVSGNRDFNSFVQGLDGQRISLSSSEKSAAWAQSSSDAASPTLSQVKVLDQSQGGYRLQWSDASSLKARVGELVVLSAGLPEDDDGEYPRDWLLGIMRWLRSGAGETLEAGVQLLSRQVESVVLRSRAGDGRGKVIQRGLLLQPLVNDNTQTDFLLVPAILDETQPLEMLRGEDPMQIEMRDATFTLGSVRLVESLGSFKQLEFSAKGRDLPTASSQPRSLTTEDTAAIWSTK
jgi:cyclic-di-GMP-binding protein